MNDEARDAWLEMSLEKMAENYVRIKGRVPTTDQREKMRKALKQYAAAEDKEPSALRSFFEQVAIVVGTVAVLVVVSLAFGAIVCGKSGCGEIPDIYLRR